MDMLPFVSQRIFPIPKRLQCWYPFSIADAANNSITKPPPSPPLTDDCDHGWYCWGISYTIFMFTWTWISCFYHKSYCQNIQIRYSSRPDYVLLNKGGFIHVVVRLCVSVCYGAIWGTDGRNLELPVNLEFIEFIRVGNVIEFCFYQSVSLRPGMLSPLPFPHSSGSRHVYEADTCDSFYQTESKTFFRIYDERNEFEWFMCHWAHINARFLTLNWLFNELISLAVASPQPDHLFPHGH